MPCMAGYCDGAACNCTTQPGYWDDCPVPECQYEAWITVKEYRWDCVSNGWICDTDCIWHEYINVDEYICADCPVHYWEEVSSQWCEICPANPDAGDQYTLPEKFR